MPNPAAWQEALIATGVISMVPIALLGLFSCCWRQWSTQSRLNILLAFSVGGLLGDTFLHLIPHAMNPHHHHDTPATIIIPETTTPVSSFTAAAGFGGMSSMADHHDHAHDHHDHDHHDHHDHDHHHHDHAGHDHSHDEHDHVHDNSLGLLIIAGIFIFMMIEKAMRLYRHKRGLAHAHSHGAPSQSSSSTHAHAHAHDDSDHGHSHAAPAPLADNGLRQRTTVSSSTSVRQVMAPFSFEGSPAIEQADTATQVAAAIVAAAEHDKQSLAAAAAGQVSDSAQAAMWLGLLSDFIHNVTDGMAIAASFLVSTQVGLTTTAAVLFHEVPHELGDYALSIAGGMTTGRAIRFQLLTAVGALVGCLLVLASGGTSGTFGAAILPITAGGFIYLALVDVMPTLQEDLSFGNTIAQVIAMALGVGMMYIVGLYE